MYEQAVSAGIMQFRDVGWFSCDLELYPKLKPEKGIRWSGQVIKSVKYGVEETVNMLG